MDQLPDRPMIITIDENGHRVTTEGDFRQDDCDYAATVYYNRGMKLARGGFERSARNLFRESQRLYRRIGIGHILNWLVDDEEK